MARYIVMPMTSAIAGSTASSSNASGPSSRTAMTMPPMIMMGAVTMTVRPMNTTVWTCCTSLVLRVMSEGDPNRATSTCEKVSTFRNTPRPEVPAEAHGDLGAPEHGEHRGDGHDHGDDEHQRADLEDRSLSPAAMPSSMMSALSAGR